MKKLMAGICIMAAAMVAVPASAQVAVDGNPMNGYGERIIRQGDGGRNWDRGDRRWRGDREWRGNRYGYYNGHRGYRERRRGYRYHDGWWFPPAAFALGAIVGGAIANQPAPRRVMRVDSAHAEWCYNRYRSYRASDNTYQPYNGPRRQCYSPYS